MADELRQLDAAWQSDATPRECSPQRLEELSWWLSYFSRWNAQLQERAVRLSF